MNAEPMTRVFSRDDMARIRMDLELAENDNAYMKTLASIGSRAFRRTPFGKEASRRAYEAWAANRAAILEAAHS